MILFLAFLGLFVSVVIAASCTTFYIAFDYHWQDANDKLTVTIYSKGKLFFYQRTLSVIQWVQKEWLKREASMKKADSRQFIKVERKSSRHFFRRLIRHPRLGLAGLRKTHRLFYYYRHVVQSFMTAFCCEKFYWKTQFSTSDAAMTGIASGLLWSVKACLLSQLMKNVRFAVCPAIQVSPTFRQPEFKTEFQCIFSFKLGNVMNAFLFIVKNVKKGVTIGG
ncbi:hypothetical protein Ga0466249_002119 [Sporomusaceae bacterium BoRhaA]|uniref:DUF2953 domain-containing protein n=1 Tax=Pelorhabdus rhamnosifermentans TaxID=2772457 RepID=UPI001C062BF6|nr:DUF2953 domain-containing protein [Pelorhabdus rhamnosifermentans]MBU2701008.1 hypothetical protein [Pelorhabdus rhamnosifermentans]